MNDQRNDKGELTALALAADALADYGCDCGTDEKGSCLSCLCEQAFGEQQIIITLLRTELYEVKEKLRLYTDPPYAPAAKYAIKWRDDEIERLRAELEVEKKETKKYKADLARVVLTLKALEVAC